jgi:hypothetical protein
MKREKKWIKFSFGQKVCLSFRERMSQKRKRFEFGQRVTVVQSVIPKYVGMIGVVKHGYFWTWEIYVPKVDRSFYCASHELQLESNTKSPPTPVLDPIYC